MSQLQVATEDQAPVRRLPDVLYSTSLLAGLFFASLGLAFIVFGQDYRVGNLRSMGPGMFPIAGGWILVGLGGLIALSHRINADTVEPIVWRPFVGVLAAVVAFALLIDQVGFLIAAPVLIGGGLLATGQGNVRGGIILSIVLTIASVIIFPTLLGVPLKVWP